jgi:hypothetical protein
VYLLCMLDSFFCRIGAIVWLVFCCLDFKQDNQLGPNPQKRTSLQIIQKPGSYFGLLVMVRLVRLG